MGNWKLIVNGREIELNSEVATGEEIKRAAGISREVKILLERYDGKTVEVSNTQRITSKDGNVLWPIITYREGLKNEFLSYKASKDKS